MDLDRPALTMLTVPQNEAEAIRLILMITHSFGLDLAALGKTPPDAVSIADAAVARGVATRTIHQWIKTGHVRAVRHGQKFLVSRRDVMSYEPNRRGRPGRPDQPEEPS